jgi:hypothetical protein
LEDDWIFFIVKKIKYKKKSLGNVHPAQADWTTFPRSDAIYRRVFLFQKTGLGNAHLTERFLIVKKMNTKEGLGNSIRPLPKSFITVVSLPFDGRSLDYVPDE